MGNQWKRNLKWLLLLVLPLGLGWFAREQRSWIPQVIYRGRNFHSMEISPDGKLLAIRQFGQPYIVLLDTQTGKQRTSVSMKKQFGSICFSPDSQQIVQICVALSKTYPVTYLNFYDVQSGKVRRRITIPEFGLKGLPIKKLVWRAETNQIFGIGESCFVLDANSGKVVRQFDLSSEELRDVELSPDGTMMASVNEKEPSVLFSKPRTKAEIESIYGRDVRLWDARNGKLLRSLEHKYHSQSEIAFSKNGGIVVGNTNAIEIQLWDANSGHKLRVLLAPNKSGFPLYELGSSGTIQFSPTENLLAIAWRPSKVCLYDADTGRLQRTLKSSSQFAIQNLCFSPDGKYLFTMQFGGPIARWRIR